MKMHIEFRHLRTIKAIEEAGGLAKAADMLHITQSALSHQIVPSAMINPFSQMVCTGAQSLSTLILSVTQ